MKNEKRFPTIIGIFFLVVTTFFGVKLTQNRTTTSSQASGDCQPVNPQITNITHNSASISFTTSGHPGKKGFPRRNKSFRINGS